MSEMNAMAGEQQEFLSMLRRFMSGGSGPARPSGAPAVVPIQDRTQLTSASLRKGKPRAPGSVHALVLHQMAFSRGSDPTRYDTVNAHFAILPDGTTLQLHPVSALLWSSNGFNTGS